MQTRSEVPKIYRTHSMLGLVLINPKFFNPLLRQREAYDFKREFFPNSFNDFVFEF